MMLRDRSRKFIGPSPTKASCEVISGKSAAVTTSLTPANANALSALIPRMRVRMRAAFDLTVKDAGHCPVGPEIGAAGDFLDPVRANGPGADDLQFLLVGS